MNLLNNQPAYSLNYRSPDRIGKNIKRHFVDPSLAAALLNINKDKLIGDLKTFGFLFEALVERDLNIYMDYLNGKIYHFRDNVTGLEVDTILEFENGEYAAVEIKLGFNQFDEAKEHLLKFQKSMTKKPICFSKGKYNKQKRLYFSLEKHIFFKNILTSTNVSQTICYHVNIELLSKE